MATPLELPNVVSPCVLAGIRQLTGQSLSSSFPCLLGHHLLIGLGSRVLSFPLCYLALNKSENTGIFVSHSVGVQRRLVNIKT